MIVCVPMCYRPLAALSAAGRHLRMASGLLSIFAFRAAGGGSAEADNLQPLCEQCASGKREFRQIHAVHADKIQRAAAFDEPQRRLAEMLLAFDGEWVRSDLLEGVASAKEYQDDWQRRLRELRDLGWNYEPKRHYHEGARVRVYYRLTKSAPWPDDMRAVLNAAAAARKKKRSANG